VVLWLFDGLTVRLPPELCDALRAGRVRPLVSPVVRLELSLLHEVGRIQRSPVDILDALRTEIDLGPAASPFERVAAIAGTLSWTRDRFDRLIVAHALADDLPLFTRDRMILANAPIARWA